MASALQLPVTREQVRAQFPALRDGFAFLENAGGSQVPEVVIDAMTRFIRESYVQTGAGYAASDRATQLVVDAHDFMNLMFNGQDLGYVALGSSTSALLAMLGGCIGKTLQPGDEIIISVANHESNIAPWTRLADRGIVVRWWEVNPETGLSSLEDLAKLITERTRIVAFALTSNLLGDVVDAKGVSSLAHAVGASVVVDCVATAPHQSLDVEAWDVDFAVMSNYKVYGPHMAALWGNSVAWSKLDGPNHFFIPGGNGQKFELGCLSYEGCAGVVALGEYLHFLVGTSGAVTRETIVAAFAVMKQLEAPVQCRLLDYLTSRRDIRILGSIKNSNERHPTVSFVHRTKSSPEIVAAVHKHPIGIRHGHMYAYRLCDALGIPTETGVVRISAVHTNSESEIDALAKALDVALA